MAVFLKKIWPTLQKVFPLPTLRAPSASNSPSALSARLDKSSGWRPQLQYRCIHATGSFNLCVCVSAGNRFKFCCQASTKYQEAVSNYPLIITFFFVLIVEQDKIQEQFEKYPHDDWLIQLFTTPSYISVFVLIKLSIIFALWCFTDWWLG